MRSLQWRKQVIKKQPEAGEGTENSENDIVIHGAKIVFHGFAVRLWSGGGTRPALTD